MANKETKDIYIAAAKIANSTIVSMEDGKFEPLSDLVNYFDDFAAIQAAVENADAAPKEWPFMTNEEKQEIFDAVEVELGPLNASDRSDIVDVAQGIFAAIRFVSRKRNAGTAQA